MTLPSTHKALVVEEKGKVKVNEQPLPHYGEDQVLVRVKAVSLNPTDWKHVDNLLKPGQSIGCDFAGDIAAIGDNAQDKGWSIGDTVGGFVRGGFVASDNGAFQEYVATLPELVWRKPASLPYEDAAPMGGIALSTAVHGLHDKLSVPYEPISSPEPFLVWGGSSGVGMYTIKLASLAGYRVVTVASKHNFDLVKQLGASAVFDYKDLNAPDQIKHWAQGEGFSSIAKGFDTISEKGSIETSVSILGQGGELVTLLPPAKDLDTHGVKIHHILVYSVLKPKNEADFAYITDWYKRLPSYIESGKLSKGVIPLKIFDGGLEDLPEALDYVRQGKVSGQKVVVILK